MKNTVFITGSSSGIGKATAKLFQAKGWNVVATMRNPEKEEELSKLENVLLTRLDVLDLDSIKNSIAAGIEEFGKIDVVVNNAGYGLMGSFESMSKESLTRQFEVNVFGTFDVIRETLPHFRQNKNGIFINISSIGGKFTFPIMAPYHATKFAIEGFSESLHYEMKNTGIRIKIIEPGGVVTDFGGRSLDFQHNENLTEYTATVGAVMKAMETFFDPEKMNPPSLTAKVIYQAATDGTDQLRYKSGADAEELLAARKNMDDEAFFALIKQNFGLVD